MPWKDGKFYYQRDKALVNQLRFNIPQPNNPLSDNFLVLAVEKKGEIDSNFADNFKILSSKLEKLEPVSHVFSFIDAPILFLNNTSLTSLSSNNIENIKNTEIEPTKQGRMLNTSSVKL